MFYATETYFTHFLEGARFPKAPVLAGRKVLYAPQCLVFTPLIFLMDSTFDHVQYEKIMSMVFIVILFQPPVGWVKPASCTTGSVSSD